jgi:flagella basal body P-ring formation protein FlgA
MIRRLLIMLVSVVFPAGALAQTAIELRSSVVLKAGSPVTLGDIADVEGEDAEIIAATVIEAEPPARTFDVDVKAVRSALDAGKVVRWGRTTLRGSTCSVTLSGPDPAERKKAEVSKDVPRPAAVKLDGPETVRTHVVQALARLYAVTPDDMRMLFEDRDKELLDTRTSGHRVDIQPTNSAATSRVGLRTYVFSGDRLTTQRTISVEVLVRRTVLTAIAPISRGQEITSADFTASEQWHAPSAATPCTTEQAIGGVTRARIGAGQIIALANVEAPVVVKKGEIVEIHCLSGSIHLKATRARALAAGRDGELVPFQLEGSKRSFKARMSGRGSAVLALDAGGEVNNATTETVR